MAQNMIWRLTNNGTAGSGNSGLVGDLPANNTVDFNADLVSIRWAAGGPGSVIDRIFVQNQTLGIIATGSAGTCANGQISTTGADNVARAQLIDNNGLGRVFYDSADHS